METRYDERTAQNLIPLLRSIARELAERRVRLEDLEAELDLVCDDERARLLLADRSVQRRELRHVLSEVLQLGCTILGTRPLTFRIPVESGSRPRSLVVQVREPG